MSDEVQVERGLPRFSRAMFCGKIDAGEPFLQSLVGGGLADEQEMPAFGPYGVADRLGIEILAEVDGIEFGATDGMGFEPVPRLIAKRSHPGIET